MAEIDKSLPNTKTTIEIPGQAEIEQTIQEEIQPTDSPVEINMSEDGGAEISFDPSIASMPGGEDHYANLAEFLDESILTVLSVEPVSATSLTSASLVASNQRITCFSSFKAIVYAHILIFFISSPICLFWLVFFCYVALSNPSKVIFIIIVCFIKRNRSTV